MTCICNIYIYSIYLGFVQETCKNFASDVVGRSSTSTGCWSIRSKTPLASQSRQSSPHHPKQATPLSVVWLRPAHPTPQSSSFPLPCCLAPRRAARPRCPEQVPHTPPATTNSMEILKIKSSNQTIASNAPTQAP